MRGRRYVGCRGSPVLLLAPAAPSDTTGDVARRPDEVGLEVANPQNGSPPVDQREEGFLQCIFGHVFVYSVSQ